MYRELIDFEIIEFLNNDNLLETKIFTHIVCKFKF